MLKVISPNKFDLDICKYHKLNNMDCCICYEKVQGHGTMKCITCKDSLVCSTCYNDYETVNNQMYMEMKCPLCRTNMDYSCFVFRFWFDFIEGSGSNCVDQFYGKHPELSDILFRNMEL